MGLFKTTEIVTYIIWASALIVNVVCYRMCMDYLRNILHSLYRGIFKSTTDPNGM